MPRKHTVEEVWDKLAQEELGYAVLWYYGRDLNSDHDGLNEMWAEAYDTLKRLDTFFKRFDDELV